MLLRCYSSLSFPVLTWYCKDHWLCCDCCFGKLYFITCDPVCAATTK